MTLGTDRASLLCSSVSPTDNTNVFWWRPTSGISQMFSAEHDAWQAHGKCSRNVSSGAPGWLSWSVCDSGSLGREFEFHTGHGAYVKKM